MAENLLSDHADFNLFLIHATATTDLRLQYALGRISSNVGIIISCSKVGCDRCHRWHRIYNARMRLLDDIAVFRIIGLIERCLAFGDRLLFLSRFTDFLWDCFVFLLCVLVESSWELRFLLVYLFVAL